MRFEELDKYAINKLRVWAEKYVPTNNPCPRKRSEAKLKQDSLIREALKLIPEIVNENERS